MKRPCFVSFYLGLRVTCLWLVFCDIVYVQQENNMAWVWMPGQLLDVTGCSLFTFLSTSCEALVAWDLAIRKTHKSHGVYLLARGRKKNKINK